jgi:hypothetical protein
MKKRMKHFNLFSIVGLVIIFIIGLLFLYWSVIQPDVIKVDGVNTFAVDQKIYHPGDHISYTFSYCKTRKVVATIDRALIDTYRITYARIYSDLPIGCHTVTSNDLFIPEFIAGEGNKYHLEGTAAYRINPIKTQYVYFRTVDFIIE